MILHPTKPSSKLQKKKLGGKLTSVLLEKHKFEKRDESILENKFFREKNIKVDNRSLDLSATGNSKARNKKIDLYFEKIVLTQKLSIEIMMKKVSSYWEKIIWISGWINNKISTLCNLWTIRLLNRRWNWKTSHFSFCRKFSLFSENVMAEIMRAVTERKQFEYGDKTLRMAQCGIEECRDIDAMIEQIYFWI